VPILILYFKCERSVFFFMCSRLHRCLRLSVIFRERTVTLVFIEKSSDY